MRGSVCDTAKPLTAISPHAFVAGPPGGRSMAKQVRLYPRDVEVLELLTSRQIETLDFLHGRLWSDCNRKSAYNRLRALANAGYLEHVKRADPAAPKTWTGARPSSEHLFTLGPKAPTALRIRGREAVALARRHRCGGIPAAFIDHQLATNRVADTLGVRLMSEEQAADGLEPLYKKHRPDGAYRALADQKGRDLILVEIDLGHYSRARIVQKAWASLNHEHARAMLFVVPTEERAAQVRGWVWNDTGYSLMDRFDICTFRELREESWLPIEHRPVHQPAPEHDSFGWWRAVMGPPGCR